jgi:hypothetical protein
MTWYPYRSFTGWERPGPALDLVVSGRNGARKAVPALIDTGNEWTAFPAELWDQLDLRSVATVTPTTPESGGPPFLQSPGGKPRKHSGAGRRPVALMGETLRTKQMEGNR